MEKSISPAVSALDKDGFNMRTLKEKNSLECNRRARKKYNAGYNEKFGLKQIIVRLKEQEEQEIKKYCKENGISRNELISTVVLNYIRQGK